MSREVHSLRALSLFTALFGLVCAIVIPLNVTVDGIFYLGNSKALFSSDMGTMYTWYREPGYPLFIRILGVLFGNAGVVLIFFQGCLLGFAVVGTLVSCYWLMGRSKVPIYTLLISFLVSVNPMYTDYSGLVLQQALFSSILATFIILLAVSLRTSSQLKSWIPGILALVLYLGAIYVSVGWIYLGLIPTAAIFSIQIVRLISRTRMGRGKITRYASFAISLILIGFALHGVGTTSLGVWENFKKATQSSSENRDYVIQPLSSAPEIPPIPVMARSFGALIHVGTVDGYEMENDVFLQQQMRLNFPKFSWDTAFVNEPITTYVRDSIFPSDPSFVGHSLFAIAAPLYSPLYTFVLIFYLLTIVLLAVRRYWKLLALAAVPLQFVLVYVASNSPIDRYGIPAFGPAVALCVIAVSLFVGPTRRLGRPLDTRNAQAS